MFYVLYDSKILDRLDACEDQKHTHNDNMPFFLQCMDVERQTPHVKISEVEKKADRHF